MRDRAALPTGTVTFLFSDIEGSTRLVQRLGERFTAVLEEQQQLLRKAFAAHSGTELGTEGDSFFVVFQTAGDAVAAAVEAQRAVAEHAWPEGGAVRVRMGLHTGAGTLGGANYVGLDVHRAARIANAAHGGQVLLSGSTRSLVESALEKGATLRDMGEHRLKDLLKPEHIFQLVHPGVPSEFPPLATLSHRPNNLPTQTSEFLGRDAELSAVGELLDGGVRLVTLTGPGGIGKTRLALQAAASRTDPFTDGLFFIDLSATRDPDEAFEAVVRTLGLQGEGDRRPLELLKEQLATKHMLLLLDNFEQVMDAADGVAGLLQRCPRLNAFVTSREALRVRGEHIYPVPPMSLASAVGGAISADVAASSEAVRLFVERAAAARGTFALTDNNAGVVAEICARLDGLPLAIELAAARLKLFSAEDLLERLRGSLQLVGGGARDLPVRQQTLRRTIEWSYDLLDTEERDVFRVLSVFSATPVESVESVTALIPPLRAVAVVDRLFSLVDKSLVRSANGTGPQRLSMLATIHEFAAERLEEDPGLAEAARRAHAEYFSDFANDRRERLSGSDRDEALKELEGELGNLLTAWRYSVEVGDLARLEGLLDGLWVLHDERGWYASAVGFSKDLLGVLSAAPSTPDRVGQKITLATSLARGLLAIGGYTSEVEEAYERALALLDEAGGLPQLFPVLRNIASLHLYRGEFDQAEDLGRRLLDLAEQSDDDFLRVEGHLVVGSNSISSGRTAQGIEHLDRAIALFDPSRHRSGAFRLGPNPGVVAHTTSAFAEWMLGHPDRALARAARALDIAEQLNHPYSLDYALFHTAFLDLWGRNYESILERTSLALRIAEEHGYQVWKAVSLILGGTAQIAIGSVEEGISRSDQGLAIYTELSTPPVFWPFLLMIRAGGFALANRPHDALELVDSALMMLGDQINLFAGELPLIKGDLLMAVSGVDDAESVYQRALDVARGSGARTTELRAATRLVGLWRASGRDPDGSDELRSVYETFAGNADTQDLVEARAVLEGRPLADA